MTAAAPFRPVAVRALELDAPVGDLRVAPPAAGAAHGEAWLLVRLHGEPLGVVEVALRDGAAPAAEVAHAVASRLGDRIDAHRARLGCLPPGPLASGALLADGLRPLGPGCPGAELDLEGAPEVDVIVPTAGRPERIEACLRGLRRLDYPRFRVLVVDNRPDDGATRAVVEAVRREDPRVHYVAERRPGSSVARNRGIAESSAELLAFTDDDVHVDPAWLAWLVRPFRLDPAVTVVTGLVMPSDMETPAQRRFEEHAGFGKGFDRRTFDLGDNRPRDVPLFPYWGARFGSGNSMAFRRRELVANGGFDPALGAGSLALAGADIESFAHAILAGGRLVYEPRSVCWHDHRTDDAAFERQRFAYWVSFTATLTKWALRRPWGLLPAVARAVPAVAGAGRSGGEAPREVERLRSQLRESAAEAVLGRQIRAYAVGPLLYVRSRRWARRLRLHEALRTVAPPAPPDGR